MAARSARAARFRRRATCDPDMSVGFLALTRCVAGIIIIGTPANIDPVTNAARVQLILPNLVV